MSSGASRESSPCRTLGEATPSVPLRAREKALGPHIFDRYIELKRKEWDEYRVQLTDWEMKKYLPVLLSGGRAAPIPVSCLLATRPRCGKRARSQVAA